MQRVPDTEASGRIHTSAATVAVLPEAEDIDVTINETDLRIDTMRAGGAGGQHVNKTKSAMRVTHIPSGIVVFMQEDRSQHRNRAKAMAVLRTRLYDFERQKYDAARAADRRGQVGSGDRSERIRTYNFPQGRVSDHRINLTLYKLPQIMEGEALGEIIDALITEHQAALLAAEGSLHDGATVSGRARSVGRRRTARLQARQPPSIATARRSLALSFRLRPRHARARCAPLGGHALGLDHAALAAQAARVLTAAEADAIAALAARRLAREPVARIIGVKEFWGLDFGSIARPWCRGRRPRRWSSSRSTRSIGARDGGVHSRSPISAPARALSCWRCCPNCPRRAASAPT